MITKKCEWCEKEFTTKHNAQKFCNANCNRKAQNAKQYNAIKVCVCACCEKEFTTLRRRTYCSDECRLFADGRGKKERKKQKAAPKLTLAEVNARARAEGLTYAQYVAKYGLC